MEPGQLIPGKAPSALWSSQAEARDTHRCHSHTETSALVAEFRLAGSGKRPVPVTFTDTLVKLVCAAAHLEVTVFPFASTGSALRLYSPVSPGTVTLERPTVRPSVALICGVITVFA